MNGLMDSVLLALLLCNFLLLGSSRMGACIRTAAAQGVLLGLLPLVTPTDGHMLRLWALAVATMLLKGWVFPRLLLRALRGANVRREIEPYVGYTWSMLYGVAALVAALWLGSRLPLPGHTGDSPLLVPAALATLMSGFFLLVSRRKALTQVVGYLTLENGIYAFGMGVAHAEPMLVEVGVLLDVFAAVFVMGIAVFRISQEFDHIDADRLSALSDVQP